MTNVFAVGDNGVILHYDGISWQAMPSDTTLALHGIWGSSPTDLLAVGDFGASLHFDGSSWKAVASVTQHDLWDVWVSSPTAVFAVGDGGVILDYDSTTWRAMTSARHAPAPRNGRLYLHPRRKLQWQRRLHIHSRRQPRRRGERATYTVADSHGGGASALVALTV
jgi:hypothetical protein